MILTLVGCQLTDKNERAVTSDVINNTNTASGVETTELPAFKFSENSFDFGIITQGQKVLHTFTFVNSGEADLVITAVEGSCGCTVSKNWPRKPIAPGETGEIEVEFNSEGKKGTINKSVSIVANTSPATTVLYMKGEVAVPNNLK